MTVGYEAVFGVQPGVLICEIAGNNEDIFRPSSFRFLSPDTNPDPQLIQIPSLPLVIAAVDLMVTFELMEIPEDLSKRIKLFWAIFEGSTGAESLGVADTFGFRRIQFEQTDVTEFEKEFLEELDNLVASTIQGTTVNLTKIAGMNESLRDIVLDSVYLDYCSFPVFTFSGELNRKLRTFAAFLYQMRVSIAVAHNSLSGGSPFRVLPVQRVNDYVPDPLNAHMIAPILFMELWDVIEEILDETAGENTVQELGSFTDRMRDPEKEIQLKNHLFDAMHDVLSELHGVSSSVLDGVLKMKLPADKTTNFVELVESWERYWLSATSMGLAWRLLKELEYLENYRYVGHWTEVDICTIDSDKLVVLGDYARMNGILGKG